MFKYKLDKIIKYKLSAIGVGSQIWHDILSFKKKKSNILDLSHVFSNNFIF